MDETTDQIAALAAQWCRDQRDPERVLMSYRMWRLYKECIYVEPGDKTPRYAEPNSPRAALARAEAARRQAQDPVLAQAPIKVGV